MVFAGCYEIRAVFAQCLMDVANPAINRLGVAILRTKYYRQSFGTPFVRGARHFSFGYDNLHAISKLDNGVARVPVYKYLLKNGRGAKFEAVQKYYRVADELFPKMASW